MGVEIKEEIRGELFQYLLKLGDDRLILGHRLSEWCGHAPTLEEDLALANISLDCIGQSSAFLSLAAEIENKNRTEDDLAYFRDENQFKNLQLVEQPNEDFAYTITRQFFVDAFSIYFYDELQKSNFEKLAAIAAKSLKEVKYHFRHSREWIVRLGDGTEESHNKIQNAVDDLWRFTGEIFMKDENDKKLIGEGIAVSTEKIKSKWDETVSEIFKKATIKKPGDDVFMLSGGRIGIHTEHLGHLLSEMQIVARSHPNAKW
jgi:ring-1,2-phenylacetyl-CoA epoxidase subunit PaaC